jgi:hypothetical protein
LQPLNFASPTWIVGFAYLMCPVLLEKFDPTRGRGPLICVQDIASIKRPAKLQPGTLLTDVIWGDPSMQDFNEGAAPLLFSDCLHSA